VTYLPAECEVHGSLMVKHFLDKPKLQKMVMNYPDILSVRKREGKAHRVR